MLIKLPHSAGLFVCLWDNLGMDCKRIHLRLGGRSQVIIKSLNNGSNDFPSLGCGVSIINDSLVSG